MKASRIIVALGMVFFLWVRVLAQVPQMINYQGRVSVAGVPFQGTGQFKFALVKGGGTTTYWSNDGTSTAGAPPATEVSLTVTKGLYSVLLGDAASVPNMTVIPNAVFSNYDVWLRVWFNDGMHGSQRLIPDQRIAAVGYAMIAGGLAPGATIPASAVTGTIPASQVATAPPGMALIPAGTFSMGDNLDGLSDAPVTPTMVSAFYMDVNLVTFSQWQSVSSWAAGQGYADLPTGSGKGANHPVQMVNWYDCVKWCNARSEQAGKTPVYYADAGLTAVYRTGAGTVYVDWVVSGYRLPTEAEWEKAARGGRSNQRFPWGNSISEVQANYAPGSGQTYDLGGTQIYEDGTIPYTSPVGSFAPNGYGLYDMAGNVFEWCWDWYGTLYAGGTDPRGPASGPVRVFRGGSWFNYGPSCRLGARNNFSPGHRFNDVGFRSVLPPGQ